MFARVPVSRAALQAIEVIAHGIALGIERKRIRGCGARLNRTSCTHRRKHYRWICHRRSRSAIRVRERRGSSYPRPYDRGIARKNDLRSVSRYQGHIVRPGNAHSHSGSEVTGDRGIFLSDEQVVLSSVVSNSRRTFSLLSRRHRAQNLRAAPAASICRQPRVERRQGCRDNRDRVVERNRIESLLARGPDVDPGPRRQAPPMRAHLSRAERVRIRVRRRQLQDQACAR